MESTEKSDQSNNDDERTILKYEVDIFDTLHSIALKYNMTVGDLLKLNNLPKTYRIYPVIQELSVYAPSDSSNTQVSSHKETRRHTRLRADSLAHKKSHISYSNVTPLLILFRQQRKRKYAIEDIINKKSQNSSKSQNYQGDKPSSFKINKFYAYDDLQIEAKNVIKEHVKRYLTEHKSILGELILLPTSIRFEPDLNDPVAKQIGMLHSQFQYDLKEIVDFKLLELNEVYPPNKPMSGKLNVLADNTSNSSDIDIDSRGPKFLQLTVYNKDLQTKEPINIKINRRSSEIFYDKLQSWCDKSHQNTTTPISILPKDSTASVIGKNTVSISTSPNSTSILSVSPIENTFFDSMKSFTNKKEDHCIPEMDTPSSIVKENELLSWIASVLPPRLKTSKWKLTYSTEIHGTSINTFYTKIKKKGESLMFIQDEDGFIFGAFFSEQIESKRGYYGTGETFLFTLFPTPNIFTWSGLNDYFIYSKDNQLALGGGGKFGLWIDFDMSVGTSAPCDTYLNSTLSCQEDFKFIMLEVWTFEA